jgi:hypothetical protein
MADEIPDKHHKKHPSSFWSFYGDGFSKAIKKSLEKYGWAILLFGLLYTLIALFISSQTREEKFWGFDMSFWLTYAIPGEFLFFVLVYHVAKAPYEIYKELYKKTEGEISTRDEIILNIHTELQSALNTKPKLELMPTFSDKGAEGNYFCRLAIKNTSLTGTANRDLCKSGETWI